MAENWKIFCTGDVFIKHELNNGLLGAELQELVSAHDLKSVNFEAPIETDGTEGEPKAFSPNICQHKNAPALIKEAGFNVISLATNHTCDYGLKALENTIKSFNDEVVAGAGTDFESAYGLKIKEIQGIKVGFLSFCEAEFGVLTEETQNNYGCAWINHPSVFNRIVDANKIADVLILQAHAGTELVELPVPEIRELYKKFIDHGVDVIIGHHPHVPQGWELYKEKPIFYSLGNFYFDYPSKNPATLRGYAVSVEFTGNKIKNFEVIPVERTKNGTEICKDENYLIYLNKITGMLDSPDYLKMVDEQTLKLWNDYYCYNYLYTLKIFSGSRLGSFLFRVVQKLLKIFKINSFNDLALLHLIRTESHRWNTQRALLLKTKVQDERKSN